MDGNMRIQDTQWETLSKVAGSNFGDLSASSAKDNEEKIVATIGKMALTLQQIAHHDLNLTFLDWKATTQPQTYNIIFQYAYEQSGKQAAKSATQIVSQILAGEKFYFETEANKIGSILSSELPSPQLRHLLDEAAKRQNIPVIAPSSLGNWQLGHGKHGIDLNLQKLPEHLSQIFPEDKSALIPIIAVTGSNGKTTTTRLIAHILKTAGYAPGFTTSDGVYIGDKLIDEGDTTGPLSAELALRNKTINAAVLETARGGIVRAGLGFNQCNISVVTNVQEDHLGISDINNMDELARVKSVIVNATDPNGHTILNAENPYTVAIGNTAKCHTNWFAINPSNAVIQEAILQKRQVAYVENHSIIIHTTDEKNTVANLADVPISFNGTLEFMTQNALAAVLAAHIFGINKDTIARGLKTFLPSPEQTPGRMNIYEFPHCKVLVDFAHNPVGFIGIRNFMKPITASKKIGIIVGTGDRRPEDVVALGRISAQMFDHILIHQVKFLRGKSAEELIKQLVSGINSENPNVTWERVPDEIEPLGYALSIAPKDSFIVALSDVLNKPIELVNKYKAQQADN
jgi:cyanophycin synthetase